MTTRTPPPRAKVAVIGAGIVGNCLVEHLARLGWDDLVLIDKGALPNPGGSTGHASNFIFPTDHGREIALLTLESQRQYEAMGANTTCGGIEVARTEARMEELRRRMTSARVWGIESELLTPAEVVAKVPFVNPDVILGGFHTPSVSVVDSVGAGTIMRERAVARGVLTVLDETEATGLEVEPAPFGRPRIRAVTTTRGTIEVDHAVIACGAWSPRVAAMAGATIPLTPAVHQMADFGPVEILVGTGNEIGYPIVRDMDSFMYERQSDGAMEVGSYAHRPILMHPDDIPSVAEAERSPTELPFTPDDFAPQLERAREIMGELLAGTKMQYAVNGLLSLTPDTQQVLGETAEVANLWSAAAVWVREGPGSARLVAEWMTHGYPRILDPHGSDVTRFQPHERTGHHVRTRCREHFTKTYGIVHPREQWESARGINRSPFHPRTEALGAEYYEARGWERPQWYASNQDLVARYGVPDRPHEWDRRWWSPIINAEHLHLREKVGVVDLGAFQIFDVSGPGVVPYLESLTVNRCDRPVGSSIYTPLLTPDGGFRADLTIQRLTSDRFRIVTGVFDGARDAFWFRRHLPTDGSVQFQDRSSAISTLGVWGPDAHALLSKITDRGLGQAEFPYGTARDVLIDGIPATMLRISYVGEGGWEIYARTEHGLARGPGVRCAARGDRRLRYHRANGEGLPVDGFRAHVRVLARRGGAGPARRQAGGLHRQGRLPEGSRARTGGEGLHAHHGRPHERGGHCALPHRRQRTDSDAGWGADRGRPRKGVARHLRRNGSVRGQLSADGVPAGGARPRRRAAAGHVHERVLPRDRGGGWRGAVRSDRFPDEGVAATWSRPRPARTRLRARSG